MAKKFKYLVGIDEVGRGPLAGPVAVCALILKKPLPANFYGKNFDSKSLSEKRREEWHELICLEKDKGSLDFAVCFSNNSIIDNKGISFAIRSALKRSLNKIQTNFETEIRLDGGLKAPIEFINQETIIKGDQKEVVIGLASIVAKVRRDNLMKKLAKKYPKYGFEKHKGYGTKAHLDAIKKHSTCSIHRRSFLKWLDK